MAAKPLPHIVVLIAAFLVTGCAREEVAPDRTGLADKPLNDQSSGDPYRKPEPVGLQHAQITVIPATDGLVRRAAAAGDTIGKVVDAARPTIGTPYRWGGASMSKGIDCSNYTWLLYRSIGVPYDRFLGTRHLTTLRHSNGLRKIAFQTAAPGDLLVYGYSDEAGKWRGHVVILVDKDGRTTGHKGLVLGAHGRPVSTVQFVTFNGFDQGYYMTPRMRLCNVLRPEAPLE